MGDRFLYDEYGEVFTANLTSKMELSAKEGEVKAMNYVSKTPSQTSEKAPNPPLNISEKSFNATGGSCEFKEGHNFLIYNISNNFRLNFFSLYPYPRIWNFYWTHFCDFLGRNVLEC